MINEINHSISQRNAMKMDIRSGGTAIQESASVSSAAQNERNKQTMVFLSKLQVGDHLKGQLVTDLNGETLLKLENGLLLSAKCLQQALSGKLQEFLITGKTRQHLELELLSGSCSEKAENNCLIDQAVKELGLKNNEQSREAVGFFLAKQLPLIKQQLVQVTQMARQLPAEALVNMVSKGKQLSIDEVQLLSDFKGQENARTAAILDGLLQHVPTGQGGKLADVLDKVFGAKEIFMAIVKAASNGDQNMKDMLTAFVKPSLFSEAEESRELPVRPDALQTDFLEAMDEGTMVSFLKKSGMSDVKSLFKYLMRDKMTLDVHSDMDDQEVRKLADSAALLKRTVQCMKEAEVEGMNYAKLYELEQLSEAVEKYNTQAQYYCFPFKVNDQEAEGELYFFKPKKNKKQGQQGIYIVLALNLPHLQKIEIHVKEQSESVQLLLKVQDEKIKELIDEHNAKLGELISETSFSISSVQCELITGENSNKSVLPSFDALTRLDTKI